MNIFPSTITQPQLDKNPKYMVQLDGLRAIAVFGVLVSHFLPESLPINSIFQPGSLGVRLFFVLSGFLITRILLKCKDDLDSPGQNIFFTLKRFYIRRFLRIFPIYYLVLFIVAIANIEGIREAFFWHFTYTSNIYFQIKGAWDAGTAHFWTLSIEEQFYLIWPFLILFISKKKLPIFLLTTIIISPIFRWFCSIVALKNIFTMGNLITLAWVDSLSLGALLAYLTYEEAKFGHIKKHLCAFCFWVGLPLFVTLHLLRVFHPISIFERVFATTVISIFFTWLIARAAKGFSGITGTILEQSVLVYLGKISYGIYVYHLFMPWINQHLFRYFGFTYPNSIYIQFALNVITTVIVAIASYHLIEHPINGLKKHFEYTKS